MKELVTRMVKVANTGLPTKREGGYFTVVYEDTEQPLRLHTLERIGRLSTEKAELYRNFAQEKAKRLHAHPEHRTSRESRNEAQERYGGAIRARKDGQVYIFSFSGFPEIWDEAFMLFLALNFNYIQMEEMLAIANEEGRELHKCLWILQRSLWPQGLYL